MQIEIHWLVSEQRSEVKNAYLETSDNQQGTVSTGLPP
jgi:hypothetical protein